VRGVFSEIHNDKKAVPFFDLFCYKEFLFRHQDVASFCIQSLDLDTEEFGEAG